MSDADKETGRPDVALSLANSENVSYNRWRVNLPEKRANTNTQ
jgi:hypothetical protein